MSIIDSIAALEARYPGSSAHDVIVTEVGELIPHYRTLIETSSFVVLATSGPGGLDISTWGDGPGFVRIVDDKTLNMPDRRGDAQLDSLRNILLDPRVALLFLIPNASVALRVDGRAVISADPDLLASFGPRNPPATALIITVQTAYFEFPRSVLKAGLWNPVTWGNPEHLPSRADMLEACNVARTAARVLEPV